MMKIAVRIFTLLSLLAGLAAFPARAKAAEIQEFDCSSVTVISMPECAALIDLAHSTDYENWGDPTLWLASQNPDDWFGVNVAGGHVVALELAGNNLTGSLPDSLGNLNYLQVLDLSNNALTGAIPASITNLKELRDLNLSGDDNPNEGLTGSIPSAIGDMTLLKVIELQDNNLTGMIPDSIGNLSSLTHLLLQNNHLSGNIPPTIGNATHLEYLDLGYNMLSGHIPAEIGNLILIHLKHLLLDNNQFDGDVPETLINLVGLVELGLDDNHLTVPPSYPVAGDPFHDFLVSKDPDWQYSQSELERIYLPVVHR